MKRTVARAVVALLAAFALLATSCGGSSSTDTATEAATQSDGAADSQAAEAPVAQATLVASTVDGGQIDFGALEGQDVVLWFWAPW